MADDDYPAHRHELVLGLLRTIKAGLDVAYAESQMAQAVVIREEIIRLNHAIEELERTSFTVLVDPIHKVECLVCDKPANTVVYDRQDNSWNLLCIYHTERWTEAK